MFNGHVDSCKNMMAMALVILVSIRFTSTVHICPNEDRYSQSPTLCICAEGSYGNNCSLNCNHCESNNTRKHQQTNLCNQMGYCACKLGYFGKNCDSPCLCINNEYCNVVDGKCECSTRYGSKCEYECNCSNNSFGNTCDGRGQCQCKNGYYGKTCSLSRECDVLGTRTNTTVDIYGNCRCKLGFFGADCSLAYNNDQNVERCDIAGHCDNGSLIKGHVTQDSWMYQDIDPKERMSMPWVVYIDGCLGVIYDRFTILMSNFSNCRRGIAVAGINTFGVEASTRKYKLINHTFVRDEHNNSVGTLIAKINTTAHPAGIAFGKYVQPIEIIDNFSLIYNENQNLTLNVSGFTTKSVDREQTSYDGKYITTITLEYLPHLECAKEPEISNDNPLFICLKGTYGEITATCGLIFGSVAVAKIQNYYVLVGMYLEGTWGYYCQYGHIRRFVRLDLQKGLIQQAITTSSG